MVGGENISSNSDNNILRLKFAAKDIYLVMGSHMKKDVQVLLNGQPITQKEAGADVEKSVIQVKDYKLYHVVSLPSFTSPTELELHIPKGIELHAFTFGS